MQIQTKISNVFKFSTIHTFINTTFKKYLNARRNEAGSSSPPTLKTSQARGTIILGGKTFQKIKGSSACKRIIFTQAQLAGINGSRKTHELIPSLGHGFTAEAVGIRAVMDERSKTVILTSTVKSPCENDVDTEAMMAVAIAALTVCDMVKKYGQDVYIRNIELLHKSTAQGKQSKRYEKPIMLVEYDASPIKGIRPFVGYV